MNAVAQAYYMRYPLDITIHVEDWQLSEPAKSESAHFWRVNYFTRNIASDKKLEFIQARAYDAFKLRNWTCESKTCNDKFDIYL